MENVYIRDILPLLDGKVLGPDTTPDTPVNSICFDTRKLKAGDFFLPIKGEHVDGHSFIQKAFDLGAVGTFTMHEPKEFVPGKFYIQVPDTATVPMILGKWYRDKFTIPFVAVTGSVGKTTTKDMVAAVLSERFSTHKTPENHNNLLGISSALLDLKMINEISVVEMGMNRFGELDETAAVVERLMAAGK